MEMPRLDVLQYPYFSLRKQTRQGDRHFLDHLDYLQHHYPLGCSSDSQSWSDPPLEGVALKIELRVCLYFAPCCGSNEGTSGHPSTPRGRRQFKPDLASTGWPGMKPRFVERNPIDNSLGIFLISSDIPIGSSLVSY